MEDEGSLDPGHGADRGHLYERAREKFRAHFGSEPEVAAYAPGRVEILGNHTDYNEGFVLSAAINYGTFFLAAAAGGDRSRLVAGDLMKEVRFSPADPQPVSGSSWPNYVLGVAAGLAKRHPPRSPCRALFFGDVPRGAGLSSSAALSVSAGLALCGLYGVALDWLDLAKIAQRAENEYVGVRTGLLDQISSLRGRLGHLVMTDFRSLEAGNVSMHGEFCFLACNTGVKHSLVDSAYNDRRASCEEAVRFFAGRLDHPVEALRDVSLEEWERWAPEMDSTTARRAAHVIGENERVLEGRRQLDDRDLEGFGGLMYASHESSRLNFENSCPELDFLVKEAMEDQGVIGARLSGGGFGGSVIMLVPSDQAAEVGAGMRRAYKRRYGRPCVLNIIEPSEGARLIMEG